MSRGKAKQTLRLITAAAEILEEIEPASVRAVCYRLFAAGLIPNMSRNVTNSVSRILTRAREEGSILWSHIVDESREAETANRWSNPTELIHACVRQYRKDYWQDQNYQIEVWSEKGTIRGTLGPVLEEYGVTFRVMHGYASATVVNDIAELSTSIDKPFVALYVGDWDPSGKHMSDIDLPRRLEAYGGNLTVERVALREDDLQGLPSFNLESKAKDPRYHWFRRHVGAVCYELDAMPPPLLRHRVEAEIRSFIDRDLWDHARMVESAEVQSMEEFHKSWQASISSKARE
jgi:hypothetical protein